MNEFEQRLQRVPVKPIPGDWRAEILAAAMEPVPAPATRESWRQRLQAGLHAVFWPHPKAWAGLAAVWVVILLLNVSLRDESPVMAEKSAPPSPETLVELRQQQQMLAELLGVTELREADRPRMQVPQPHTQLVRIMMG